MIDFSKALDLVDHAAVVKMLYDLSLPCIVTNWLVLYLSSHKIILKCTNKHLQPKAINRGIVQGSGMGPTVYIIRESDLTSILFVNVLPEYVNDTNLLVADSTDFSLFQEIDNIKLSAVLHEMVINFNRTKEMIFYGPNPYHCLHPQPVSDIEQVNEQSCWAF